MVKASASKATHLALILSFGVVEDEINDPMKNSLGSSCRDRRSIVRCVSLPGGSSRAVLSSQVHDGCRRGWSILIV